MDFKFKNSFQKYILESIQMSPVNRMWLSMIYLPEHDTVIGITTSIQSPHATKIANDNIFTVSLLLSQERLLVHLRKRL